MVTTSLSFWPLSMMAEMTGGGGSRKEWGRKETKHSFTSVTAAWAFARSLLWRDRTKEAWGRKNEKGGRLWNGRWFQFPVARHEAAAFCCLAADERAWGDLHTHRFPPWVRLFTRGVWCSLDRNQIELNVWACSAVKPTKTTRFLPSSLRSSLKKPHTHPQPLFNPFHLRLSRLPSLLSNPNSRWVGKSSQKPHSSKNTST